MRRDEDVIGAAREVPEGELRRNVHNRGGDEGAGVADRGEAVDLAEIA